MFNHDKHTLEQAIVVYHALVRAKQTEEAYDFALEYIVGHLTMAGFYQTLLSDWLPDIRQAQTVKIKGEALNQTSNLHLHLGQFDSALDYLKRALTIAQDIGDKAGEGSRLNNIATVYLAQGDYDSALDYFKPALTIAQNIGDKAGEGTRLNNIATAYHAKGDYDSALDYLKRALSIAQDIGDTARFCASLFNIGHIHLQNNQQQEAMAAWIKAYQLAKSMGLAQVSNELKNLAGQFDFVTNGLPPGLEGWEALSRSHSSE